MPSEDENKDRGDASTAKQPQRCPATSRCEARGLGQTLLLPQEKLSATSISDFQLPDRDNTFLWCEPPSLWNFVMAALAN